MTQIISSRTVRSVAAVVAVVFGIVTVYAGGRVLLGSDPGYLVFRPLVVFNTVMGLAYIAAGLAIARHSLRGRNASGMIFVLNLLVLIGIVMLFRSGDDVAVDSVRAMSLRTVVWLLLFAATAWLVRFRPATLP